ncbi:MAG: cytidine deaminase [Planctomycetes bacterium]|nr:cytidine deaminase [Planctomycetota bacterium]
MTVTTAEWERLAAAAWAVRSHAYAPASGFQVGAAVLAADGRAFVGCNVENASYGLTICAERAAVCAAVAAGARDLRAVAIATALAVPATPCGACRQVLAEFGPDLEVLLLGDHGARQLTTLAVLLPAPFTFARLRGAQTAAGTDVGS